MIPKFLYKSFFDAIYSVILAKEKLNKTSVEKLASTFGITDKNTIKEITETAIVTIARKIANQASKSVKQKYDEIVNLYKSQVNLSHRTSQSMLLQQYSTPATIAYLMGIYCKIDQTGNYYEPSAGNGMLTIANTGKDFIVNEIDETRSQNLEFQDIFKLLTKTDSSKETYRSKYFDAIIINPPFSTLNKDEYLTLGEYEIKHLDHKMAILALNSMKENGKAAIIVGGHTSWDDKGRIQAGKNRIFLSYLYKNYKVEDIILIDGNALYSKMGTGFDTRIILINGRKPKTEGFAPIKNHVLAQVIKTTDDLYSRFVKHFEAKKYTLNEMLDDDLIKGEIEREDAELKKAGWSRNDIQGVANFVANKSKNITVSVLRYKANGNDLTDRAMTIESINNIDNAFISTYTSIDEIYVILKLTKNNKTIYFEEGSYSQNNIQKITQAIIDKAINRFKNNLIDTTTIRHISKLSLEVAETLGYDYKKLQQIRDAFYIQKRENEVAQQKQKEQQKVDYAKKEIENAVEKFRLFAFGNAGIDYDTIEILIKQNNLEKPHIRTIGSLRKRNVVFKNQGKLYTYNNWQSKVKSKYKIHTDDAIFIIIEKLKEIYKNSTPNKGKALRLRAKAISIKQKQLLQLGQLGVVKIKNTIINKSHILRTMPQGIIHYIAKYFDNVYGSPFSSSFYSQQGQSWDFTPKGQIRVADHWNFLSRDYSDSKSEFKEHGVTNIPVINNDFWTIGKKNENGVYDVILSLPKIEMTIEQIRNSGFDKSGKYFRNDLLANKNPNEILYKFEVNKSQKQAFEKQQKRIKRIKAKKQWVSFDRTYSEKRGSKFVKIEENNLYAILLKETSDFVTVTYTGRLEYKYKKSTLSKYKEYERKPKF